MRMSLVYSDAELHCASEDQEQNRPTLLPKQEKARNSRGKLGVGIVRTGISMEKEIEKART